MEAGKGGGVRSGRDKREGKEVDEEMRMGSINLGNCYHLLRICNPIELCVTLIARFRNTQCNSEKYQTNLQYAI